MAARFELLSEVYKKEAKANKGKSAKEINAERAKATKAVRAWRRKNGF